MVEINQQKKRKKKEEKDAKKRLLEAAGIPEDVTLEEKFPVTVKKTGGGVVGPPEKTKAPSLEDINRGLIKPKDTQFQLTGRRQDIDLTTQSGREAEQFLAAVTGVPTEEFFSPEAKAARARPPSVPLPGAQELLSELERKQVEQPSIVEGLTTEQVKAGVEPPLFNIAGNLRKLAIVRDHQPFGITGFPTAKRLLEEPGEEMKRATAEAGIGLAIGSLGLIGSGTAGIVKSGMSAKLLSFGGVMSAITSFFLTRQVLDYKGGELDTMREMVGSFTEDGERLQAFATQGGDIETVLTLLQDMSDEIDFAEARIKDIGNNNIAFKYDKEYLRDLQKIRSARAAITRRVSAVINIAAEGRAQVNPGELMYIAEEFKSE